MRRTLTAAVAGGVALAAVVLGAAPASADHTHFRILGNGDCVLLAAKGGEKHVVLPHAEEHAEDRRHPLHVKVHLGRPGETGRVHVAYLAGGVMTPAALQMCGGEFIND